MYNIWEQGWEPTIRVESNKGLRSCSFQPCLQILNWQWQTLQRFTIWQNLLLWKSFIV